MSAISNKGFLSSNILKGWYLRYINKDDPEASWNRYSRVIIEEEEGLPNCFDGMDCPEGVPEDICKICYAAGENEYLNGKFGLFDGYSVMEILEKCEHGEIVVRSGLQTLHW